MNKNISVVMPVYNAESTIEKALESLLSQPVQFKAIYIINDGSTDNSAKKIKESSDKYKNIFYIFQDNQGEARALNTGLKMVKEDFVAVIEGDVVLENDWILKLMPYFENEKVAAVSGLTKLANSTNIWSAFGGYNVEYRQSKIKQEFVDQLSTCNTIYRKSVLDKLGLFDGKFTYGLDNEISYRMIDAGYKLILSKKTFCLHFWPESFMHFIKQRSHGALGRMMLIDKYPKRWKGDKISSLRYFLELPLVLLLILFLLMSLINQDFLILAGITVFAMYLFQLNEIKFFFKKKKVFIGALLPFFSLFRSLGWISGIMNFYLVKNFIKK